MVTLKSMEGALEYPLNTQHIKNALGNKVRIITYKELQKCNTIEDVLKPFGKTVIHYSTTDYYGHWVCVFINKKNGCIYFFDSYGLFPDDERKFVPKTYLKKVYNEVPHIIKLLAQSNRCVRYNHHVYQHKSAETCGRWCIIRLVFDDLDEDEFYNLFKKYKGVAKDMMAVFLTQNKI